MSKKDKGKEGLIIVILFIGIEEDKIGRGDIYIKVLDIHNEAVGIQGLKKTESFKKVEHVQLETSNEDFEVGVEDRLLKVRT